MWNLHIFPDWSGRCGYIKTVRWRWQARLWMIFNGWRFAELRCINTKTGEHMTQ